MTKFFNSNNYPKVFVRLKPSKTVRGEIGAFAMREFKGGEIIVKSSEFEDDNIMSVEEYNKLDEDTHNLVKAHSTIVEDKLFVQANLNFLRPINYFNHSCDPNVGFDSHDNYVAIKHIAKGDEFLLDYSFLNTNPDYQIECCCGSPNCRHLITGSEWKNQEFVNKNFTHFASTIRDRIKKLL